MSMMILQETPPPKKIQTYKQTNMGGGVHQNVGRGGKYPREDLGLVFLFHHEKNMDVINWTFFFVLSTCVFT